MSTLTEKIENRHEYNLKVIELLVEQINKYPTIRIGQLVSNLFDGDRFYEEPEDTYERLSNTLK